MRAQDGARIVWVEAMGLYREMRVLIKDRMMRGRKTNKR